MNSGLPTYPFSGALKRHVGRYVDSTTTTDNQGMGMRTARAGKIRIAPARAGVPARAYLQVGAALAAFSLDTFFTQRLPGGMTTVDTYQTGLQYYRHSGDLEKVAKPDAFIYPESPSSGWQIRGVDGQERLFDFDYDDRGYIYAAYMIMGWGLVKDSGETGGTMFGAPVAQVLEDGSGVSPTVIFSVKVGTSYYAAVSGGTPAGTAIYNTTTPNAVTRARVRGGFENALISWAKSPNGDRIAIVTGDKKLRIFDAATYVNGGEALATFSANGTREMIGVAADRDGNFWGVEKASNLSNVALYRYSQAGATYTSQEFGSAFGEPFSPFIVQGNDNYITVGGFESGNNTQVYSARVFKIEGGEPKTVDVGKFFRNYYHNPPSGYAKPEGYTNGIRGISTVNHAGKTYLIYGAHGLGDVFELQGGDSVSMSYNSTTFGTPNVYSRATQTGPFYGDVLTFSATPSTPGTSMTVDWDFGNPEAGAENAKRSTTGANVTHQYSGLQNAQKISEAKTVRVQSASDSSVADTNNITLKVPVARISNGISVYGDSGATIPVVYGDTLTDASDGSIEGHVARWTIDGTTTNRMPHTPVSVGQLGSHTLSFSAVYGPYDANTLATKVTPTYTSSLSNITYQVRPYLASINAPTVSGNTFTFSGTARRTLDAAIIFPVNTTWTVTWWLFNGGAPTASKTETVAIGTIPNYVLDKSAIPANARLVLSIVMPETALSTEARPFRSFDSAPLVLAKPDPRIDKTGCDNAGNPCTLSVASISGDAVANWTIAWTINNAAAGSTATITPSFATAGTYNVSVKVTKAGFDETVSTVLTVAAPTCGPGPGPNSIAVNAFGLSSGCRGSNCTVGETFEFGVSPWQYTLQDCDNFSWNFGDGGTANGRNPTHIFQGSGPFTVTLTVTNPSGTNRQYTKSIAFAGGPGPGPGPGPITPTCTAPGTASVTYYGTQGCNTSKACKTTEQIFFQVTRANGSTESCDSASWTFSDGSNSTGLTTPGKQFASPGTYTASAVITNSVGSTPAASVQVVVEQDTNGSCPAPKNISIWWTGSQSGCVPTSSSTNVCRRNEAVNFEARAFNHTLIGCERYLWEFGDGATSAERNPSHVFAGNQASFNVKLRVYTDAGAQANVERSIILEGGTVLPVPELSLSSGAQTVGKGATVTFTATSSLPNTTGWSWSFGDGTTDLSQASATGSTSTISHTYANAGTYVIIVTGRNAEAGPTSTTGRATRELQVVDTPEHRFLLPVVAHLAGQDSSVWRTDLQVYTPDPSVSSATPMVLSVTYRGQTKQIEVPTSTFISEDFMKYFSDGDAQGPMIVSVQSNHVPQLWTRTYNQTTGGTFGQFIPAILISGGSGTSANAIATVPSNYYLPGIRSGTRYRTNVGFVNPTSNTMNVTATAYLVDGTRIGQFTKSVPSFDLVQVNIAAELTGLPVDTPFNLRIGEIPAGQWIIGYASQIDRFSNDPTYVGAISDADLASTDFNDIVVPGVGHINRWRSDVTIMNPDFEPITVDLAYYNQNGEKVAESNNISIDFRKFIQLDDLLRAGYLAPQPADGLGMLRIRTRSDWTRKFPLAYSRTYFDKNVEGSYGQGIPAFSVTRANVKPSKPAVIPAVRSDANYYTNIGLVNLTDAPAKVKVTLLRADTGAEAGSFTFDLAPNQSIVRPEVNGKDLMKEISGTAVRGSFRVEVLQGGNVWAFASVIDRRTSDPEYIAAVPLQ